MIPHDAPSHTSLTPFTYHNQPVRTTQHADGTTWWVASDVCAVLALRNASKACARLDDDEKGITIVDTPGGPQELLLINEPGLYSLITRSRKKEATDFRHWVFHEVLIDTLVRLDRTEQLALRADATATRAEGKADLALAEIRVMTLADFILTNGLLRQLPQQHWQAYARWLTAFCQEHGLPVRKDPVPGRPWSGENVYPVTALGALVRYEQTRPRQVTLVHPRRSEL